MYRDATAGLKNQIAARRAELANLELQVSPLLRCLLPSDLRKTIDALYPRVLASGSEMASLVDIASALDELIAIFKDAHASAPHLRTCPDAVPDPAPPEDERPWLLEEPPLIEFRDAVASFLESMAPDARFVRWGDGGYLSRFHIGNTPLVFTTKLIPSGQVVRRSTLLPERHFVSTLRTSLPEALPFFGLRPEGWTHKMEKALHLSSERELGIQPFDGRFWVTGSEAPTALLTEPVRGALLALTKFGPELRVGHGLADLTWSGYITPLAGEQAISKDAVEVIAGIRNAITGSI